MLRVIHMPEKPTSVRFDTDALERFDRVAAVLSKRSAGLTVGRTSVIKLAVERGLPILEAELKLTRKRKV